MNQCPFCLQDARQLGGIILITPGQLAQTSGSEPITGACCVDCLGLIAILLGSLKNGRIRTLADTLIASGNIVRR